MRFDPLPPAQIAARLKDTEPERAQACARLALGDARLAARLASEEGEGLRAGAEAFVRCTLRGASGERRWTGLLDVAKAAGEVAGETEGERLLQELELVPSKERKRYEREGSEARRRAERRARTQALDLTLRLAELWLRDVLCIAEGAPELRLRRGPPRRAGRRRARVAPACLCAALSSSYRTHVCVLP